jgi:hypothetical protein
MNGVAADVHHGPVAEVARHRRDFSHVHDDRAVDLANICGSSSSHSSRTDLRINHSLSADDAV